ncbi:MAG: hypothetical protein NC417_08690 [Candidatus Gastranaerophilales bacterium]|nr:hypothetical protein [Candidatus Gastranaerophilales bacterium]
MNIEAYNLDSLRQLVRDLQKENRKLKQQLDKANIAYDSESIFDGRIESAVEYDPDQGERIIGKYITEGLAKKFFAMFWGRIDVYAKRGKTADISHSVITAGMTGSVRSSVGRRQPAKTVGIQSGQL